MSYGGQPNAPWQRNIMQSHPQSGGFHQGSQMFMQSAQQNNMAAFGHGGMQSGGGNMFPGGGAGGGGGNVVAYPQPRSGLNPVAFQQGTSGQSHYNSMGTVTKISNECGLVNDEIFFYRNVCKGPEPKLGDRVIFEATYSNNGQFKWNATRVQIMQQPQPLMSSNKSGYNSVAPPNDYHRSQMRRNSPKRSPIRARHDRDHRPQRSRDRDETDEQDRKRRREERSRERDRGLGANNRSAVTTNEGRASHAARSDKEREPKKKEREITDREREERERERARDLETHRAGPKGRRARTIKRYMVQIPKSLLTIKTAEVQDLRRRFSTLYIPSDFFHANIKWSNTFTPDNPFSLRRPCQFHIMHEFVDPPNEQTLDLLEPPDANYLYSAKVMLMSLPPIAEIYKKCFESENDDDDYHPVHPSRLINFLVGVKGRVGSMAIGGPWSPSLDGDNPDKDPSVLIRTAIRTCKALTGIDLSNCTQWYRFVELYYHRTEYKNMEKDGPPRIETVIIYLPDVHSCLPNLEEWQTLTQTYKNAADCVIARRSALIAAAAANANDDDNDNSNNDDTEMVDNSNVEDAEEINTDNEEEATMAEYEGEEEVGDENEQPQQDEEAVEQEEKMEDSTASAAAEDIDNNDEDDDVQIMDAKEEHAKIKTTAAVDENDEPAPEPTHYTQLDLKTMKVQEIRDELLARNLSDKGMRNVVMARLAKALNTEKTEETKKKIIKAKQQLKSRNAINKPKKEEEKLNVNTESSNRKTTADKKPLDEAGKMKKISVELEEKENANEAEKTLTNDKSAAKGKGDKEEDWADIIDFELSDIVILDEYDSSKNAEEANLKEMTEKEKIQLIRRYTLPTTPHIVVHPNRQAKGGKFDCAVVSLSLLLDYHPDDSKERFFEVSLFAELFNDMLMRDFGFNIYKELYLYEDNTSANISSSENNETKPEVDIKKITTEPNDEIKKENDDNKEKSSKKESKTAGEDKFGKDHYNDDTQSIKSESRKRKISTSTSLVNGKEREAIDASDKKMVVIKPLLLLSFVYFDTTHCGYIFERDLEDLFSVLGLNLSRAQIKKVLGKLATRQAIYYRKLTEKEESIEATPTIEDVDNLPIQELKKIAAGNNQYESVFDRNPAHNQLSALKEDESGNKEGLINFNGTVVHVGKLLSQINRTEKNYSDLEKLYNDLLIQHTDLQKHHTKSSTKIKDLQAEVKSVSRKLTDANQDFYSLNRKFRDQNATLSYIYTRVAPYFIKEKDKDKEGKSGEGFRDKEKDKPKDKESEREKCREEKEKGKSKEDKDKEKPKEDIEKEKSKDTKEKEKSTEDKVKEKSKDNKEKDKEKEKPKEDKEKEKPKENKEKEKSKEDKEKEKPKENKEKEKSKEDKEKEIKKIENKPAKDDKEKSIVVKEKETQPKIIKEKPKEKAKEDIKTKAPTKDVKVKPMVQKNIDKAKSLTPAAKKVTGTGKVVKKTENVVSKK